MSDVRTRPECPARCSHCDMEVESDHWRWNSDKRYSAGGRWRCVIRKGAAERRRRERIAADPERREEHLARAREYASSKPIYSRYKSYRSYDNRHGRECLDWAEAESIMSQPCHYCGLAPGGGLDRIDNERGHALDNVRPCCMTCNGVLSDLPVQVKDLLADGLRTAREGGLLDTWIIPQMRR